MSIRVLCLSVALVLAACGDDHDHGNEQFICDGNEDSFDPGTEKLGEDGLLKLIIVSADPAQHYVQNNTLVVRLEDDSGTPLDGADFVSITPFTAKHNHGTPVEAQWMATGNPGEYSITDINYVHRGPWRLTFEINASGTEDTVEFIFCIADAPGAPDSGV